MLRIEKNETDEKTALHALSGATEASCFPCWGRIGWTNVCGSFSVNLVPEGCWEGERILQGGQFLEMAILHLH